MKIAARFENFDEKHENNAAANGKFQKMNENCCQIREILTKYVKIAPQEAENLYKIHENYRRKRKNWTTMYENFNWKKAWTKDLKITAGGGKVTGKCSSDP